MSGYPASAAAASSSSAPATASVAATGPGRRKKEKIRRGYTRLIHIREFAARYADLNAKLSATCAQLANEPMPDLSVDDIAIPTPFQAIEKAIDQEVARVHTLQEEAKKAALEAATQQQKRYQEMLAQQAAAQREQRQAQQQLMQQQFMAAAVQALQPLMLPIQMQQRQQQMQQQQQRQQQELHLQQQQQQQQQHRDEDDHDDDHHHHTHDLHMHEHDSADRMEDHAQQQHQHSHEHDHHSHAHMHHATQDGALDHAARERLRVKKEAEEHAEGASGDSHEHMLHGDGDGDGDGDQAVDSRTLASPMPTALDDAPLENELDLADTQLHTSSQEEESHLVPTQPMVDSSQATGAVETPPAAATTGASEVAQHTANLQPNEPDLPSDFGLHVPNYDELVQPLQPLQKHRQKIALKRDRADINCMTSKTFEYDIKSRTSHQAASPLPANEVILRVAVFHSTNSTKTQEFIVCGSSSLASLRDRIYCLRDHTLDGPHTPSACFFIEGRFYDDMRDRRAICYSDTVIEWVKSDSRFQQPGLAHFDARDMHNTRFNQLAIRLGSHYLFRHQGNCDHTIIFTQLRMAHANDVQNTLAYPLKPFQCKTKRRKCRVCDLYPAAYVTYGDKLANENPFFYCEECYRPLHYSYQGNLLYNDFQVYSYDHE